MVKKLITLIALSAFPLISLAIPPTWKLAPESSTLEFIATQNNAPVKGTFKHLESNIQFSPTELSQSHIQFEVYTDSITMGLQELAELLKTKEWLSSPLFPKAVFTSKTITKQDNEHFVTEGELQIKGKTLPVQIKFTLVEYTPNQAHVKGTMILHRTDFSLGEGEWASTTEIQDNVTIQFNLLLTPNK